ncbi:MAG: ferrous iron transport protein B [Spirochaetia bacterium]
MADAFFSGRVAFIGNPNAGKSTLFNAITGSSQQIGNWPGVTIEKKSGQAIYKEAAYEIVDLPGIYQLHAQSDDEKVALDYLQNDAPDLIVNIVDASNLDRHLYLTLQLLEIGKPLLLALNMMDIATREGVQIDIDALRKCLGCPIVALSGLEEPSALRLKQEIAKNIAQPPSVSLLLDYPPCIKNALHTIPIKNIGQALLELIHLPQSTQMQQNILAASGHSAATLIAQIRYDFIRDTLMLACSQKPKTGKNWTERIDAIVLNRWLCVPIFFATMYVLFSIVQSWGGIFVDFFDAATGILFVEYPHQILTSMNAPGWIKNLIAYGIGGGIQAISAFIPVVFLMFFCLGLLEQSGYLARSAFVMDRLLQMLGLPGKSFIPLLLGFGCTTTAVMATRGLNKWNEKLVTAFMAPLMSCSARVPVYAIFAAAFFGSRSGWVIFSLYVMGIALAILTGLLFGKTVFRAVPGCFLLELPKYHRPKLSVVFRHASRRLRAFFWKSGRILVIVMAVVGTLNTITPRFEEAENESESILSHIGRGITPIFTSFGVAPENWPASVALVIGFFAKESVVSSLGSLYLQDAHLGETTEQAPVEEPEASSWWTPWPVVFMDLKEGLVSAFMGSSEEEIDTPLAMSLRKRFSLGPWQAYAYLVFVLLYVPCIGAVAATIQEIGLKATILLVIYLLLGPWSIATLVYQLSIGWQFRYIALAIGMLAALAISLWALGRYAQKYDAAKFWIKK